MHCFHHPESEAVGICSHCQKGLCPECAADLEFGLACRGRHEEQVIEMREYLNKNLALSKKKANILFWPSFFVSLGLIFGLYGFLGKKEPDPLQTGIGVLLMGFGAVLFVVLRNYFREDAKEEAGQKDANPDSLTRREEGQ